VTESTPIHRRLFSSRNKPRQSGNIFAILFGAVAMTGILAVVGMQQVTGPISTITKSTQKNRVDSEMMTAAKILISSVATQANSSDCDADGFIEPEQWRATTGPKPTNGGLLPNTVGATTVDPWGTEYGYCVWDHATVNHAGCGGGTQRRLRGPTPGLDAQPVMAVIAAGPDKAFQTTCRAWVDANADSQPDQPMVEKTVGSDDYIIKLTYGEASGTGAGLWDTKVGATTTAEIQKNLEIKDSGGATMVNIDNDTGIGDFMGLTTDIINAKTGGIINVNSVLKLGKTVGNDENDITNIDELIGFNDIRFHSSISNGQDIFLKPGERFGIATPNAAPKGTLQLGNELTKTSDTELFMGSGTGGNCRTWSMGTRYAVNYTSPAYDFIIADRGCNGSSDNRRVVIDYNTGRVGFNTDNPAVSLHSATGTAVGLAAAGYMTSGLTTGENLTFDNRSIMARDNGVISRLHFQASGGTMGINGPATSPIQRINIDEIGSVGLGLSVPLETLDINGDMVLRGGSMYFSHDGSANANNDYIRYLNTSDLIMPGVGGVLLMTADRNRNAVSIADVTGVYVAHGAFVSGRMGIRTQTPTDPVDVNGDVKVIKLKVTSDARLKTDIRPLREAVDGIDLVKQIMPVRYHWKDKTLSRKEQIGLLAQDLEKILPEAVGGTEDHKAINYIELLPVLIETIQEQQAILKDRSAIIDSQIAEINHLQQKLGDKGRTAPRNKTPNGYDQ